MARFSPDWEPTLLREDKLAYGIWHYQGATPYTVELLRHSYNYSSFDILELEQQLHPFHLDYIDYSISDSGAVYFWRFSIEGHERTRSPTFSTYYAARDHISTYEGQLEVQWLDNPAGA